MANHSLQRDTTSSLPLFLASECIVMVIAFGMESVAIVTLNALTRTHRRLPLKAVSLGLKELPTLNKSDLDLFKGLLIDLIGFLTSCSSRLFL